MSGMYGKHLYDNGIQSTYEIGNKNFISDWFDCSGVNYGTFATVVTSGSASFTNTLRLHGCKLSSSSYVIAYVFDTAGTLTVRLRAATISGTTSTFGTEVTAVTLAGASSQVVVRYISDNKILLAVSDNAATLRLYTYTASGNTLTQDATIASFASSLSSISIDCVVLSATRAVCLYTTGTTTTAKGVTIGSGTLTADAGTLNVKTSYTAVFKGLGVLSSTSILAAYSTGGGTNTLLAKVISDGGSSLSAPGSEVTLCTTATSPLGSTRGSCLVNNAGTSATFIFQANTTDKIISTAGCTVSGTTITSRGSSSTSKPVSLGQLNIAEPSSDVAIIEDNGKWVTGVGICGDATLVTPRFIACRDLDSIIVGGKTVAITGGATTTGAAYGAGAICLTPNVIVLYNTNQTIAYSAVLIK